MEIYDSRTMKAVGGVIDQWDSLPVIGSSRNILLGWNSRKFSFRLKEPCTSAVHVALRDNRDDKDLFFGIYSPCDYADKLGLWEEL